MNRRRNFSADERRELWARWKAGENLSDISRALGRKPGTIHSTIAAAGGIAPAPRTRRAGSLRADEREEISRGLAAGDSIRRIAANLGRAPSTVSREVQRNGGRSSYRAEKAEKRALAAARRPKDCKLAENGRLRYLVARKLSQDWSPEQISGWLRSQGDSTMSISHETIYKSLYVQARGVLKKELQRHLRTRRVMRKARSAAERSRSTGAIQDEVSIRNRPEEVDARTVPGHWEGDLLAGGGNTHVATLVERVSRFTMLVPVASKDAVTVRQALSKHLRRLPAEFRKSVTWDRGSELAQHRQLSIEADVDIYFCDPQSPWQRGLNENTNGLLRQYMPKGTRLDELSPADLSKFAQRLNTRPRKALDFETPANVFVQMLR